jgi:hypothetical protein
MVAKRGSDPLSSLFDKIVVANPVDASRKEPERCVMQSRTHGSQEVRVQYLSGNVLLVRLLFEAWQNTPRRNRLEREEKSNTLLSETILHDETPSKTEKQQIKEKIPKHG